MINFYLKAPCLQSDLIPLFVGRDKCKKNHSWGPFVRDHNIIHFCVSGKGMLECAGKKYSVLPGELFLIREGELTTYTADGDDPWNYSWIGFIGSRAKDFFKGEPIIKCPEGIAEKLSKLIDSEVTSSDIYTSLLYELLYEINKKDSLQKNSKLSELASFIRYNYMREISVSYLAKEFGFERSYLYRIFKTAYGMGIKEYIIHMANLLFL